MYNIYITITKMAVAIYTKCKQLDYINTVKITRFTAIYTTYCK